MEDDYKKDSKIIDKTEEEKKTDLIISILRAKKDLDEAIKNFEYAENELIDYYTYQIKANNSKLDYLVKQAKSNGIVLDMVNQIKIKYIS